MLPKDKYAKAKTKKPKKQTIRPGHYARARALAGNDMAAGLLLYRIDGLWRFVKNKLQRHGDDWIAMSRSDWAKSSGLTINELKDRALPRLKKHCGHFVQFKTMRLDPTKPNLLWVSYNDFFAHSLYEDLALGSLPGSTHSVEEIGE